MKTMAPEIISKVALILFGLLSIAVILLIWKNPSGESNITSVASLLAAVALVAIAAFPYLKIDEKHEITSVTLFRDSKTNTLVAGKFSEPYNNSYQSIFSGINTSGTVKQTSYPITEIDESALIEKGILQALITDFGNSDWDSEITKIKTVFGTRYFSGLSVMTGSPSVLVSVSELKKIFSSNKFIASENGLIGLGINVPVGTTIKSLSGNGTWGISFDNADFKLEIVQIGLTGSTLKAGVWGIFNSADMNRYTQKQHTIITRATTKFGKRKVAMIESYWKWYQNILQSVSVFDWKNIDQQILDYHTREQLWKRDKLKSSGGIAIPD